ncbi:hypothetical protein ACFL6Y_10265 [Elusimicrobiota bacterium]
MICPKCASANKDDALFCEMCYEPFKKETSSSPAPPPTQEASEPYVDKYASPVTIGSDGKPTVKLSGWSAIVAIVLAGAFMVVRYQMIQTSVNTKGKAVLKRELATQYYRNILEGKDPSKMSAQEVNELGDQVMSAKKKIDKITFKSMSARRGRDNEVLVRAEILVDGKAPPKGEAVRYFRMTYSSITGWRYRYETSAFTYYLHLF